MDNDNKSIFSNKIQDLLKEELQQANNFFSPNNSGLSDPYQITPSQTQNQPAAQQSAATPASASEQMFNEVQKDNYEGQLSMDVFQDKKNIYVKAAIAGVKPEDIDIQLNNDLITIKGKRDFKEEVEDEDYYIKECYWGGFSRSIILPVDIKTDQVKAEIDNGLLTITLPKSKRPRHTKIEVQQVK